MNKLNIFDSHLHFNMNTADPYKDLVTQITSSQMKGCLLILNYENERNYFMNNIQLLQALDIQLEVALMLDFQNIDYEIIKQCYLKNIEFSIKIHPRLSNITLGDFNKILLALQKINYKHIIVDGFYYGPNLRSHINIELLIFLSKYLPSKRILFAHSGGHKILETMLYTRNLDNIYYDLSFTQNYFKNTSISLDIINFIKFNYGKILFGSDYPEFSIEDSKKQLLIYMNKAGLSFEAQNKILIENSLSFFRDGG
ncbi:hypothetical protein J40TS1_47500 [Paenibacillus montaniterrae]|uniref:Amidohydrolase-related domain-containing protein n=1 Tax=Paenibacillus montaniterrae TaxID=429341 RepID=A0A919YS68_9BACL|nr:amidohydrolase family protein [Paenibacillus montaniterrae]GIP19108.1 hypothetical protein J40TS1_47500 [Paenibacillus montaniterrae]